MFGFQSIDPRYFTDGSLQLETEALGEAEVGVVGQLVTSVLILDLKVRSKICI